MKPVASQHSEGFGLPCAGDRVLVVVAGGVDRLAAAHAARLFERIGVTCTVLDVSSPGGEPAVVTAGVRAAFEELADGAPASARTGIAGAGSGAGPALAAAAQLATRSALPGVLVVNGRFGAAWRPFAELGTHSLLLRDDDASWTSRRTLRQVRRELAGGGEIAVLGTVAPDSADALDMWCCLPAVDAPRTGGRSGRSRRRTVAGLAGLAVTIAPAVSAAPAAAGQFAGGKTIAPSAIAGDGFHRPVVRSQAGARQAGAPEGKKVPRSSIRGDGVSANATGSGALIGGGFKFFVNTNITFSSTSSASGAASEASATAAVDQSTATGGTVNDGLSDAFDGYNAMAVHVGSGAPAGPAATGNPNYTFYNQNAVATSDCEGRQLVFPDKVSGDLTMSRRVWVSTTDAVARWLNVFTNTSGAPIDVTMYTGNNLGSDSNTRIFGSSSGDTVATTADSWVGTFQNFSGATSSDPRIGHVLRGASASDGVSSVNFADGDDNPYWSYTMTLAPGATKIIANYAVLAGTKALAAQGAAAITAAPPLDCMTADDRSKVANFDTTEPVITAPATQSATTTSASGTLVSFTASAVDAVDGDVPVTCTPPSGSTFPVGTTTVTCHASDASGNTATTTFDVVVALRSVATPVPPDPSGPSKPSDPSKPTVVLPPRSRVHKASSRRQPMTLSGTASGTSLRVVRVSIGRHVGRRCRFLRADLTFSQPGDCHRMTYVDARGITAWSYKLPRLPAGRYMVWSRAVATAGTAERKSRPRNLARFTIRAR